MRSDLIAFKHKTIPKIGSKNMKEQNSFFGSKMMKLEKNILINDNIIQYYDIPYKSEDGETYENVGFQGLVKSDDETENNLDLVKLKEISNYIQPSIQNELDYKYNTKWDITIKLEHILTEYLYSNIKKSRTFSLLMGDDVSKGNINNSLREYISLNLLDRYKFKNINLYVVYNNIIEDGINTNTQHQYSPTYNFKIKKEENKVYNINTTKKNLNSKIEDISVKYTQTKSSDKYNFEYYYEILFELI